MKFVFADDDEVTLFLYKRLMRSLPDHEAVYVLNGKEALSTVKEATDVLFLDLNMPEMDGLQFLSAHALLPESEQVKNIFVMIGSELFEEKKKALQAFKLAGFIAKPLRQEKLLELVELVSQ